MRRLTGLIVLSLLCGSLACAADNDLTKDEKKEGWVLLFNGKNLKDWMTNRRTPSKRDVEDGAINPRRCGGYILLHKSMWTDYVLKFDYKTTPGANSGVFLRQFPLRPPRGLMIYECGIEIQILGAIEDPMHDTGSIYDLVPASVDARNPGADDWNHMEITVDGPHISVILNGQPTAAINLDEFTEKNKRPDGSEHKFNVAFAGHPRTGYLGFQDHGDELWFKNVKLKPLNGTGPSKE